MMQRKFAIRSIEALQREGWALVYAWDGGEKLTADLTPARAVDWVEGAEMGSVRMKHPTHGAVSLHLLFQHGEPEDVIYDMSASSDETLNEADRVLSAVSR